MVAIGLPMFIILVIAVKALGKLLKIVIFPKFVKINIFNEKRKQT